MMFNPWLIATSVAFTLPYIYAARMGASLLSFASLALATVSSLYHATKDPTLFWIDQVVVIHMAAATLLHGYRHGTIHISCSFIGVNMILYYVGWYFTSLIWSHTYIIATTAHAFMHVWTIVGIFTILYASHGGPRESSSLASPPGASHLTRRLPTQLH
jgi:hypothetical protein